VNAVLLIGIFMAVYAGIKSLRRLGAEPIAVAFIVFTITYWLFQRYVPSKLGNVFDGVLAYLPIFALIVFQAEIRRAFKSLGRVFKRKQRLPGEGMYYEGMYDEIVLAAATLVARQTGALIVIERSETLKPLVDRGVLVDAELSYDLLISIFDTAGPLHDGAVIIQGNRVAAACVFGPLALHPRISRELGTRHRAAIAFSEDTDAVAVVVSEETGIISFTQNGEIHRRLDAPKLRQALREAFSQKKVMED